MIGFHLGKLQEIECSVVSVRIIVVDTFKWGEECRVRLSSYFIAVEDYLLIVKIEFFPLCMKYDLFCYL
jgi:hypothetical protein